MKTTYPLLASCLFLMTACNNNLPDEYPDAPSNSTGFITLKLGGEFLSTSDSPLASAPKEFTRATGDLAKTLYAVNVTREDGSQVEHPFAYGLFDSQDKISIYLGGQEGNKFHFYVTTLTEEGDKLHQVSGAYAEPFVLSDDNMMEVTNRFVPSQSIRFKELKKGTAMIEGEKLQSHPRVDRFYGETTFTCGRTSSITVNLKRAVFGLKFNVIPPQKGSAVIAFLDRSITVDAADLKNYTEEYIYSFADVAAATSAQETEKAYEEKFDLTITWTGGPKPQEKPMVQSLSAKRRTMTTLNIDFEATSNTGITLDQEDKVMKQESQDITVK